MAKSPNDRSNNKKVDQVKMGRPKKKFQKNRPKQRRRKSLFDKIQAKAAAEIQTFSESNIPANNENSIIFEQIRKNYTNRSVVKNIDTAFSYYKFPPTTKLNVADFSIPASNIDILENVQKSLVKDAPDNISGYHVVPTTAFPLLGANSWKRTSIRTDNSWNIYEKNSVGRGELKRPTPFLQTISGQPLKDGKFYLTPDIIKTVTEQGKAIKFKIQFTFNSKSIPEATMRKRYADGYSEVAYNPGPVEGVTYPYEYNCGFNLWLRRISAVSGWHYDNPTGNDGRAIYDPSATVHAEMDYNTWRLYRGAKWSAANPTNSKTSLKVNLQYIIDPRQMKPYDYWEVASSSGNPAYYITTGTYWEVELIDDPGLHKGNLIPKMDSTTRSKYYGKQVIMPKRQFGGYDRTTQDLFPAIGPGMISKAMQDKAAREAAAKAKEKAAREAKARKDWLANEAARVAAIKAALDAKVKAAMDKVFKDKGNKEADKAAEESSFTSTIQPNPPSQAELDAIKANAAAQIKKMLENLPFGKKGG